MLNIFDNICLKFVGLLPDRSLLADYVTCQKSAQASLGRLGMGRKIWLWILRFKFWSNPYEKTPTLGQLSPKCQMSAGISKYLLTCSPYVFTKIKNRKICMALDFEGQILEQSMRENANFRPTFFAGNSKHLCTELFTTFFHEIQK